MMRLNEMGYSKRSIQNATEDIREKITPGVAHCSSS